MMKTTMILILLGGVAFAADAPSTAPATSQPSTQNSQRAAGRNPQAKATQAKVQIAMMETALKMFEVDCGRFPTQQEGLASLVTAPAGLRNWHGPYLRQFPVDPWEHPFVFQIPGPHNFDSFDLYSRGPDGVDGSADDICNWAK
jgi:general secretion pathway protein G